MSDMKPIIIGGVQSISYATMKEMNHIRLHTIEPSLVTMTPSNYDNTVTIINEELLAKYGTDSPYIIQWGDELKNECDKTAKALESLGGAMKCEWEIEKEANHPLSNKSEYALTGHNSGTMIRKNRFKPSNITSKKKKRK